MVNYGFAEMINYEIFDYLKFLHECRNFMDMPIYEATFSGSGSDAATDIGFKNTHKRMR